MRGLGSSLPGRESHQPIEGSSESEFGVPHERAWRLATTVALSRLLCKKCVSRSCLFFWSIVQNFFLHPAVSSMLCFVHALYSSARGIQDDSATTRLRQSYLACGRIVACECYCILLVVRVRVSRTRANKKRRESQETATMGYVMELWITCRFHTPSSPCRSIYPFWTTQSLGGSQETSQNPNDGGLNVRRP